ncbi:hypothetical protein BGX29_010411 [Mortierella sp. GBA35]|nr:hypothetical protein BGX29_010411 [Mortierella sp. GBA35]
MPVQDTVSQGLHGAANLGQDAFKKGKGFLQDFKDFITKGNAFDLAVAFIISAALSAVIKSLVDDIITPFFGLSNNRSLDEMFIVLRCGGSCEYPTRALAQADGAGKLFTWNWGHFINTIIYLLLVGLFLFIMVKIYYTLRRKSMIKDKQCQYCCKDVNGSAVRCPFCTAWLDVDVRRKVDSEFNSGRILSSKGERSMSMTTPGTQNGVLKEKGSIDALNDSKAMATGAAVGTSVGMMSSYNNVNNVNNANNSGYMGGQNNNNNNMYGNQLPDQQGIYGMGVNNSNNSNNSNGPMGAGGYPGQGLIDDENEHEH